MCQQRLRRDQIRTIHRNTANRCRPAGAKFPCTSASAIASMPSARVIRFSAANSWRLPRKSGPFPADPARKSDRASTVRASDPETGSNGIADVGDADPTIVEPGCHDGGAHPVQLFLATGHAANAVVGLFDGAVTGAWRPTCRYRGQSGPVRCRKCSDPQILRAPRPPPAGWQLRLA